MNYDYIIVGGGPTGLTLAWLYRKYKVLLIEKETELGGCHRVKRVNGFFTEHGPRVYTSNYFAVEHILNDIGIGFYNIFAPDDRTSFFKLLWEFLPSFTIVDFITLSIMYVYYTMINVEQSKNVTMHDLFPYFSLNAQAAIERICKITDGGGANRYTSFEFFQIVNQNIFYKILQPKKPNDVALFVEWEHKLKNAGIEIWSSSHIFKTNIKNNTIDQISVITPNGLKTVTCGKILFCTPIKNYIDFLSNIVNVAIPKQFLNFEAQTRYNTYISITLHYFTKKDLPNGYPPTEWGIEYLILPWSDYQSATIVSTAISNLNAKSTFTNLTANETIDPQQLGEEVVRQLKFPKPNVIIVSPCNYYDESLKQWMDTNSAFIRTIDTIEQFKPFINVDNIGTQTGQYKIAFTSMESATQSAINYYNTHTSDKIIKFATITSLNFVIIVSFVILILLLFIVCLFPMS